MSAHNEYLRIHKWLKTVQGKANKCTNKECSRTSKVFHWCLKKDKEYDYKIENFIQLCSPCHSRYDHKHNNFNKFEKDTVSIRIYPKTHKRLKIKAAKLNISLAETTDVMSLDQTRWSNKKGI